MIAVENQVRGFFPRQILKLYHYRRPATLVSVAELANNVAMNIPGRVRNSVVVLEGGAVLSEGTRVLVAVLPTGQQKTQIECQSGQLPLVGGAPGSVNLTNQRIAEILEADDIDAMKDQWNVPS